VIASKRLEFIRFGSDISLPAENNVCATLAKIDAVWRETAE
jgi:hypothetical protein